MDWDCHVTVGMHRQGYDLQLTQYDDRGWRAPLYTTGMEHSPTSATGTGWERMQWHAIQRAGGGVEEGERGWLGRARRLRISLPRSARLPEHYAHHAGNAAAPPTHRASGRLPRLVIAALLLAVTGCVAVQHAKDATRAVAESTFPPEWAPQEAIWLGWAGREQLHRVQVEMIQAMAPHVRIRLMVTSDNAKTQAANALDAAGIKRDRVEFFTHKVSNFWTRDAGPRFLSDGRHLAIADFAWNAYGYPHELLIHADLLRMGTIPRDLGAQLNVPVVSSAVVAEGGALDVSDTVILSYKETALQRNPGVPSEEIEREYLRVYRKQKIVWLDRYPLSDRVFSGPKVGNYFGWGANGHIDEYVRFVNNSTIVVAQIDQQEADWDPISRADYKILRENLTQLRAAVNVDGRPFHVITLPAPALRHYLRTGPLREEQKRSDSLLALGAWYRGFEVGDEIHWVPAVSYLNFVVTNGVVLVPAYWREGLPGREREKDEFVRETFQRLFPERRVVQINPLDVNMIGGGMHCITQQQPRVE